MSKTEKHAEPVANKASHTNEQHPNLDYQCKGFQHWHLLAVTFYVPGILVLAYVFWLVH